MPTRKWWAATIVGAIGLATMLLTGDSAISDPEIVALGTFGAQRVVAYLTPNDPAPGGVPVKA